MLSSFQPRLRTVFIVVNVVILLIPLGGIFILRLYESALIRRTERVLIATGAVAAAAYREELARELDAVGVERASYGTVLTRATVEAAERYQPITAQLNLAVDPVWPQPSDGPMSDREPHPAVARAGARLSAVLREAQRVTLVGVRIVDLAGTVIASSRGELGTSLQSRVEVRQALRGEPMSLLRARPEPDPAPPLDSLSRTNRLRVFVALPVVDGQRLWGAVVLSRTPMSVGQSLYGIRWHLAAGAFGLLLTVYAISAFTSHTVTRPVHELILQTERVALGDKEAAVPLARPGTYEVAQLSTAVARMARALEQRAQYISTFATNVSHEFKTPLTSIRGTAELLRDHLEQMSASERDRFLGNLDQDAERLQRLVGRLLELARADVIMPAGDTCDVASVLATTVARDRGDGREIVLEADPAVTDAPIAADTLASLLGNLLDNARRHGGDDVQVVLATRLVDDGIELTVGDDGPGISAANQRRVFDAFFTTARDAGGTGLGLSIARTLVEAHDGTITVDSRPGRTVFCIHLPAVHRA